MDQKVERVVADTLQVSLASISDSLAMSDLQVWDSLKHMELIVALEEAFDIQLTFDEIVAMQSVGAIKRVLGDRGVR